MRATLDRKMQQLLGDMARARAATEREDFDEARETYLQLRATCAKSGIRSAHVAWCLAAIADELGEFEEALKFINEATELDPLAVPYQRSYNLIVERIRKTLGDEARSVEDPTTPQLYELLIRAGEGDVGSHLAMARHLMFLGRYPEARKILEAVTVLAPACRAAWICLAGCARALGNGDGAARAEIEAAALEGHEAVAFSIGPRLRS